jgi:CHAT domain-containing protein
MKRWKRIRWTGLRWARMRWTGLLCLFCLTMMLCMVPVSSPAVEPLTADTTQAQLSPAQLEQRGRQLYDAGRFQEAAVALQQAAEVYRVQGDRLHHAIALSNLTLAYQQLGAWSEANQAIATSLGILRSLSQDEGGDPQSVLAQVLDLQGSLQLAQGQSEQALSTWEQATALYRALDNQAGVISSTVNQAQALQALGLYRRAIATLTDLNQTLQGQPPSPTQAIALRSLGDALRVTGDLEQSRQILQTSLTMAQQLGLADAIAETQLSLGNTARAQAANHQVKNETALAQQDTNTALALYEQAATATSVTTRTQAQLNALSLLLDNQQWSAVDNLIPVLQTQLDRLPPSRSTIYARINLAQSLMRREEGRTAESVNLNSQRPLFTQAATLLTTASQQAKDLRDQRAESYALGNLGSLYEKTKQWSSAQTLTQQALLLSQSTNASDIAYRWQWQLGRLLKLQGNTEAAIATYSQAIDTLQTLRNDLVAINRDVQFSFREEVEPVYRQLVDLLMQPQNGVEPDQKALTRAREVIELLQVAELDNFFREACLDAEFELDQVVDQERLPSAILYPIILPDRLEVILKLPQQQELLHYTTPVPQAEVEAALDTMRRQLTVPYSFRNLQATSKQVYDWLIRPAEAQLSASPVDTLVFVLDGSLRNIPMASLYDGQAYLVEKYRIALAPGLKLFNPRPLEQQRLNVLVAGLSEARHGFTPLNYVNAEVETIESEVPSVVLLNQAFTESAFQSEINTYPFPVVHIATHGQFSSNAEQTFILAWDNPIDVNKLNDLLRTREADRPEAIELLVLSACQTATGDRRAALGLAGVAVRAGARSTLASLWSLDDESGAVFMSEFYRELASGSVTKAQALQQAQLKLLADSQYRHPRYWAPYVLLGNWL